jgi:hypothetical protein
MDGWMVWSGLVWFDLTPGKKSQSGRVAGTRILASSGKRKMKMDEER